MKPMSFDFQSRRSMVVARGGMVCASNPLAAQSGLQILRQGGNAADAAIATAAMLNVTEPASTGIGGDCFALYYDAKTKQVSALNGSGRAPAGLTLEVARKENPHEIGMRSPLAISIPGTVAGWNDLLTRHGRMTLKETLADAIRYARDGYPVGEVFATGWQFSESMLRNSPNTEEYLPAPKPGQLVKLPSLARSLEQIAEGGTEAFYTGEIADAIVRTVQELGGVITHDDLKKHISTWDTPITTTYRGLTVYQCPPNGQGLAVLQALNIAEGWNLAEMAWDSPERLHLMIEAMRLAFADTRYYVADQAFSPAPLDWLLSKEYAAQRRAMVSADRAMQPPDYGKPLAGSSTVYLSVVDGEGNACSFINSLYAGFGTGIVAKGTGIFLQNRAALFSLDPDHPNVVAPNKRPFHTIIPGLALESGDLWASFGVMGGFMQPQGQLQVLVAMRDDDLNPQEALHRPRFCLEDGTVDSLLALEDGIPPATMKRLAELGHNVRPISGFERRLFGDGQIIRRDAQSGVLFGGSDPRKDGLPAAF
ncbi:MAG: gamma-glutamyltransferase [Anaerolineae bacterium]